MDIDKLVENYFAPQNSLTQETLWELFDEVLTEANAPPLMTEDTQVRFSETIDIPRLVPSEAWGDPNSQSRQEINKVFASITGGKDIRKRLDSVKKFLTPATAKKKKSPSLIINMMMITEALQATLNDFNESASGFVFEGFLAALTGGRQEAGRVKGTLPIEDFVAFSEFGADTPVSLKLLGAEGNVKGSFTNLVDFLLVRGVSEIKYLITYKTTTSQGVEGLLFFAFDINTTNFVDFILGTRGDSLLAATDGSFTSADVRQAFENYVANPSEGLPVLAQMVTKMGGYQKAGFLHDYVEKGEIEDPTPEQERERQAARDARQLAKQAKVRRDLAKDAQRREQELNEMLESGKISLNQAFHQMEKISIERENILNEASGDAKSQWSASWSQMRSTPNLNFEVYGELDLSQKNIDELVDIYSEVLGETLLTLLKTTKEMTENIGTYYSAKRRTKAQAAGRKAESQTAEVKDLLEQDPRYQDK